jgi:putative acetyltransferase
VTAKNCGFNVTIRPIAESDVATARALHARSFATLARDHHTDAQIAAHTALILEASYRHELLSNNLLVAEDAGRRVVATAGWCPADAPETARIRKVFVEPALAGRGLGARLVREAEAQARLADFVQFVVRANANAVGFYERLGYRSVRNGVIPVREGIELPVVFMEKMRHAGS